MKIQIGKYTYTGREAIERAVAKLRAESDVQQAQLNLVGQWAREQLKLHQPYTHNIDVSCFPPDQMAQALAAKIAKDLWCARCSNPWPCRHIARLQQLREISRRHDVESLAELADTMNEMPAPERRAGQIDVGL